MSNQGEKDDDVDDDEPIDVSEYRPKITPPPRPVYPDPVKMQKKADRPKSKPEPKPMPEKPSVIITPKPSMGTRIGLQYVHEVTLEEGQPRVKYIIPRTKKQEEMYEKNRKNTAKKFCIYESTDMPKPEMSKKLELDVEIPSPEISEAKVAPRRVSPTTSWLYPYPQTQSELELKKPRSGIFINEKGEKVEGRDYDSFDLVYARKPRPSDESRQRKKRKKRKKRSDTGLSDIIEDEEGGKKKKKGKKGKEPSLQEQAEEELEKLIEGEMTLERGEGEGFEDYLTKQFRRKVSQMSRATSYQSGDFRSLISEELLAEPAVNKYIQKFRRESEIKRYSPKKRKFKRGTLESHSFTNIHQPLLRDFFFGSKGGSMHQGDSHFPDATRNIQGIAIPVAAYCYSILRHPNLWTTENIDEILEFGNNLCLESSKEMHIHNLTQELKPQDFIKYCVIGEKKVRFRIEEPEVSGYIRSDNKKIFNLTKALKIFFARQAAGIFKSEDISYAIWKDKYFYFFDARPRTKDLYVTSTGTAIMANFYDIPSLTTVLLDRSNLGNWPFIIYPIRAVRVIDKEAKEVDSNVELDIRSNYNILNENKAVVLGSFDLADKCFDFSRNKQALPMAVICLVYSRITPPSAWHKTTIDKIMITGNQLYLECMECEAITELRLDSLPAIFTIGPYIVEIYIYANLFADLMVRNCCCQLTACLEQFFEKSTNAILNIEKFYLAVWKQRNMYYCFDPYSRNGEALQCRDGTACVSMHANLTSLIATITTNFDSKDMVFYVHALKVCKIHRDPVQSSRFPKHLTLDDFPVDEFKKYKMRKAKKSATEKPVTVDYSALAMKKMLAGMSPENSIFEIGSTVESLAVEQLPPMVHKYPSRSVLKSIEPKPMDTIADLDSPSLSDTQIIPELPQQPKGEEEIEFLDLDSFEMTMEEIELQEFELEEGEAGYVMGEAGEEGPWEGGEEAEDEIFDEYEGGGEDDWYYALSRFAQVREESLMPKDVSKISEQVNTVITYFPINRKVLYPTYLRGKQMMKSRLLAAYRPHDDMWYDYVPPEPQVTQSEELRKETNFVLLPDDTEIIRGSKNLAEFSRNVEFMAPFVCIMACVVSKKYNILSWNSDIVDYILKCGNELYNASKLRYDQVSKLEIPNITLGTTNLTAMVEYVFDTYTRKNILELAIDKILFVRSEMGVLVTPTYACALFYKNYLYYMYDGFGSNEVGLSEGPDNEGTACFARFKDIHSLATRIMYNKKKRESNEEIVYTRFVLSSVKAKEVTDTDKKRKKKKGKKKDETPAPEEEDDEYLTQGEDMPEGPPTKKEEAKKKKEPTNRVGYQYKDGIYILEGTKTLKGREQASTELKQDHFVCLCACLMLMTCPVEQWDTKKVDQVIEHGRHVYSHADDLEISVKRTIKNVLIQKNFFDIIVKRIKIEQAWSNSRLSKGIDTILGKKLNYFLVQFANACYVIHKSQDECYHLFDPYGYKHQNKTNKACWVKFRDLKVLQKKLKRMMPRHERDYSFYNFEVTSIQKAPKEVLIGHRLQDYELETAEKKETFGRPFYEDVEWLKADPIPWSRKKSKAADGNERGKADHMWRNWDIEYANDLYSLLGNINQNSERFSEETRGKQTLANLVTAIGMMEIYELGEWNSAVVDSILVNGDFYFAECIKDISEEDYEISFDDLKPNCSIFPFSFEVAFTPTVEGTMFQVRPSQFNLYKSLRFFFDKTNRRCGIICSTRSQRERQVAFGKLRESEYFMFDCNCFDTPMFPDKASRAYVLRTTTLNRLLHVLTLTLRGGDFYIYEVAVSGLKPIS